MSFPQYSPVPKLIGTFLFSDFTTINATRWKQFSNVLKRNVTQRTFIIRNTTDQPTNGAVTMQFYESTLSNGIIGSPGVTPGSTVSAGGGISADTSEYFQRLATHVDSVTVGIPIGATLPLSGQMEVWVVEEFFRG